MMDIVIGAVGSLIATGLITFVAKWLWPNINDRCLYKGIRIEGVWDLTEERSGGIETVGKLELKQQGCRLRGTSVRTKTRDGQHSQRKFHYYGSISGNQVTMIFEDAQGVGFDTGTNVFTVYNDGKTMVGMTTFHGKAENKIVSEPRKLLKAVS
ncbi:MULTISPECIES: hypothetical protein [Citrobacter]|uniref:hypothetical protein n=1 Tax=Citrobacter TaxID=544 RepID=UPI0016610E86|nr:MULTISPECIES: hypothetical protein [Citrobacter]MBA4710904.1 hypothetical protein [Citrobacter pasteurii]MBD0802417.1 hypothetical protein [Citrobacter sp. C6_1]MBD0812057.1 hypothetical protein [Citrobacter sp. C6_2]